MFLLLTLLAACGPHLDADGNCVALLKGSPPCPTEETCFGRFDSVVCQEYTVVSCADEDGFFGELAWCDADGVVVARSVGSDTEEYCDGRSYQMTYGTPPPECTGEM